jgi:hypothetical protein
MTEEEVQVAYQAAMIGAEADEAWNAYLAAWKALEAALAKAWAAYVAARAALGVVEAEDD